MNKVVLIGRLTKDPELRFVAGSGTAVTTVTLAIDKRGKDNKKEAVFINVVVWGKQAENTANYMVKGKLMAISGRIDNRSYEGKDGSKRFITEVVAEEVQFLEYKNKNEAASNSFDGQYYDDDMMTPIEDGEIPF